MSASAPLRVTLTSADPGTDIDEAMIQHIVDICGMSSSAAAIARGGLLRAFGVRRWSRVDSGAWLYGAVARSAREDTSSNATGYVGCGTDFDRGRAAQKAICEAVERACFVVDERDGGFFRATYSDVRAGCMPLESVVAFSPKQLDEPSFSAFRLTFDRPMIWRHGWTWPDLEPSLLPVHLVYTDCGSKDIGPTLRLSISTGAALGANRESAMLSGLLEVLERDAFSLHHLAGSAGVGLDVSGNPSLRDLVASLEGHGLECQVRWLPTDLDFVSTICALVVDRSGAGPAVAAGLKCARSAAVAAHGAILEAIQSRAGAQIHAQRRSRTTVGFRVPRTPDDRAKLWADPSMIPSLGGWLGSPLSLCLGDLDESLDGEESDLAVITRGLTDAGHMVYGCETTPALVRDTGLVAVKAVVPTLHPLHMDEMYPYRSAARLRAVWGGDCRPHPAGVPHFFV